MAIYHLRAKIMSRSKGQSTVAGAAYRQGGHSAVHAAAYRSGMVLHDARTGRTYDYGRKEHVEHSEIIAPESAPAWVFDRQELWNRVEASEKRADAQLARELEISLPRELGPEACQDLVRDYVRERFVSQGMVADIAIHRPDASDGGEQPHAHVMLTMRPLLADGSGFGGKKVAVLDGATGQPLRDKRGKIVYREWAGGFTDDLGQWRAAWADAANAALERAGEAARIDHRSLEAQGMMREPLPNLPSFVVWQRVSEITGRIRERLGQWIAISHRNRVREQVYGAHVSEDPSSFGLRILDRLLEYGRQLGMNLFEPDRSPGRGWEFEHDR
jgi:hypothetical protein